MISTPFGTLSINIISINKVEIRKVFDISIQIIELEKTDEIFRVDKRYKVDVDIKPLNTDSAEFSVYCGFNPIIKTSSKSIEGGEHLSLCSWYSPDNLKLSIGTEDDDKLELRSIHNNDMPTRFVEYFKPIRHNEICDSIGPEYMDYGIKVNFPNLKANESLRVIFGIAWVKISDSEREDIFTWIAADPTIM